MFAYCCNNPIMCSDETGYTAGELTVGWGMTMWGLTLIDGPLPIGDIVYGVGYIVCGIIDFVGTIGVDNTARIISDGSDAVKQIINQSSSAASNPPPNGNDRNNNRQRNGTPRNNQAQNHQIDDICKRAELSKYQRRLLHDEISGHDLSYQEILEIAYEIKGLYLK